MDKTFAGAKLRQLTRDDSWVTMLSEETGVDANTLKKHPMHHVLTNVGQFFFVALTKFRLVVIRIQNSRRCQQEVQAFGGPGNSRRLGADGEPVEGVAI